MDINDLKYDCSSSFFKINDDELDIWGHTNELLGDHLSKTKIIFDKLKNKDILTDFYTYFFENNFINLNFEDFEKCLYDMIYFHDIAKISFNFQINKLNNDIKYKLEKYGFNEYINQIESKHSYISSLLFTSHLLNKGLFNNENNIILLLLPYIIYGHHTDLKDVLNEYNFAYDLNNYIDTFSLFSGYINENESCQIEYQKLQDNLHEFLKENHDTKISFFYSYIYSLLVTSDVVASSYSDKTIDEVKIKSKRWNNRIDNILYGKMNQQFLKLEYNKSCKVISPEDLISNNEISNLKDINDLRKEMLKESSLNLNESLKNDKNKRIFYLNMPTGGGKTNTSMKLALDILKKTDINRIIYAMPFINIIEQNYDVIKDNFNLNEDNGEIRKIYHATESIFSQETDDNKSEIIWKDSFFDYPVICTTFVSIFNCLIKNKKSSKYNLSSLTNSVIILDEVQSLPLKNWTSLYYLINELSLNYNIYFIIMSATLPNFSDLKLSKDVSFNYDYINLINEPAKYISHKLFDRTEVKNNLVELNLENGDITYFTDILEENFNNGYNKCLITLNTIKSSKLVYDELFDLKEEYGFKIDLLNSTIIPSEKKKIIYKINNMDNEKYVLVSTQSIEAGVDVSFDFVIRDFAPLDSIEQIRGRCNRSRELNKRFDDSNIMGNIYLINLKRRNESPDYKYIYKKEESETRIKETMNLINENYNYNYFDVLKYYESISKIINNISDDNEENFVKTDRDNIENWDLLKYSKIMDKNTGIHIIDNKGISQYSFFISTKLDILVNDNELNTNIEEIDTVCLTEFYNYNEDKFIFSLKEILYLKSIENKYNKRFIKDNIIDGSILIEHYEKSIEEFKSNINSKKIFRKEFSSILYKFIFQVSGAESDFENFISEYNLKPSYYFYKIPENMVGTDENCIYSMKNGFNFDLIKKNDDVTMTEIM
ncbi:CRISPR-associated helicase Cas3' [Methanobrevibacter sp.]|uniref:CRISPR-associated helicase Cas3' n=1 Tax=Methanobrevibacter sp. TaxID=66852 RepID=UPI002634EC76|nr:CRISPR-associated helicase Cas3' [uncultured Methanobrevibacter sp.]